MSHVYVMNNGSIIGIDGGKLKITQKDELIRTVPKETVESISVFGNSSLTTPCLQYLMETGIPVSFFSERGKYYGRIESTSHQNVEVLKKQFEVFDDENFMLKMGRKLVIAKIHNQMILLKRYTGNVERNFDNSIAIMSTYKKKAYYAESVEQLMGFEGIAARNYFDTLSQIIHPDFAFRGRTRRPPTDKFNSMLSLGYTLLIYEIYGQLQSVGLSPYYSVLHKSYNHHPALASDLMEEWRAVIVDSTVLSMIQGNEIHLEDFREPDENGGVFLTNSGMNKFIKKFERKMNTTAKYLKYDTASYSFRQALRIQCGKMKEAVIKNDADIYCPIEIK